MNLIGRLFGPKHHPRVDPTPADVAAVDVGRMIATARERGDLRGEHEVIAALLVGAHMAGERHPDADLRLKAAAAEVALRDRLVREVGEERAAQLFVNSTGPVGEDGRPRRP